MPFLNKPSLLPKIQRESSFQVSLGGLNVSFSSCTIVQQSTASKHWHRWELQTVFGMSVSPFFLSYYFNFPSSTFQVSSPGYRSTPWPILRYLFPTFGYHIPTIIFTEVGFGASASTAGSYPITGMILLSDRSGNPLLTRQHHSDREKSL
jgi:hypothetical protein